MKGIEKITARIEADAGAETAQILREAEERAAQVRADYEAQAASQSAAAKAAGQEAAQRQAQRLESAAQMEAKKRMLAAKQACVDEAFARAQKKLMDLPDKEYAGLLAKMAVQVSKTGKEEILLNARDRQRVGQQVVAQANALLGKRGALTLSGETRDMEGGLTLRDGKVEVNCAFETRLRFLREEMAAQVAGILFA